MNTSDLWDSSFDIEATLDEIANFEKENVPPFGNFSVNYRVFKEKQPEPEEV